MTDPYDYYDKEGTIFRAPTGGPSSAMEIWNPYEQVWEAYDGDASYIILATGTREAKKPVLPVESMPEDEDQSARMLLSVVCASPDPGKPATLYGKHAATLWMWVWPKLIGWPKPVTWLFSIVNEGRDGHPGDVWGVDEDGELIIVEGKTCSRSKRREDPFGDFVGSAVVNPRTCELVRTAHLRGLFRERLERERSFIKQHARALREGRSGRIAHTGLVPCSSVRSAVWAWRGLYLKHLKSRFTGDKYPTAVERNLTRRAARRNPTPHFVGLMASLDGLEPELSARGKDHRDALIRSVGESHVHAVSVAWAAEEERIRISSRAM